MFEGATSLAESTNLLPLRGGMHTFLAEVGLVSVLQGSQFDLKDVYLSHHRIRAVDWKGKDSVVQFPCLNSIGDVLNIPARKSQQVRRLSAMFKL